MVVYQGKGLFPGVAFGTIHLLKKAEAVEQEIVQDAQKEWERFLKAKQDTDEQLEALYEKAKEDIGEDEAMIIDVQRMMLVDFDFNKGVENMIRNERFSAAYAVSQTGQQMAEIFASMDDAYMKERATDVRDVSQRLTDTLVGRRSALQFTNPVIVVADDLTPSETLQMDKTKIRAFVMRKGSANSHTAILARMMNIPCIIQADIPPEPTFHGQELIVDGEEGTLYLEPDADIREKMLEKQKAEQAEKELLEAVRGLPSVTKDGRKVKLYANIGGVEDVEPALSHDAEGVGLFRSEFLYLGRGDFPSEEELFTAYRKVAEGMGSRLVVIRTLDIGADKQVDYFQLDEEENPALGLRGIRICIDRPDLFRTQLRAIYRASAFGHVAMMFPMIVSAWEVRHCKAAAAAVRHELAGEGVSIGEVALGIMIETPAAVMLADDLAKEVDFFSVGTNDLTQYTLAIDRQNDKLERFYDAKHPAVLAMLKMIAQAAKDNGIWSGVCGELAADPELLTELVNMGFDELSVSPAYILRMRKHIREMG